MTLVINRDVPSVRGSRSTVDQVAVYKGVVNITIPIPLVCIVRQGMSPAFRLCLPSHQRDIIRQHVSFYTMHMFITIFSPALCRKINRHRPIEPGRPCCLALDNISIN